MSIVNFLEAANTAYFDQNQQIYAAGATEYPILLASSDVSNAYLGWEEATELGED